jgi:lysophospholipase L1-like esterase
MPAPRLFPLGDSITKGTVFGHDDWGYRNHLQDLLGIGTFKFVGPYTDPASSETYDVCHGGVDGDLTSEVDARVAAQLTACISPPNRRNSCVLLLVGTNDAIQNFGTLTSRVDNTEYIVDKIYANDPYLKIYVALIIPIVDDTPNQRIIDFNAALNTRLVNKKAANSSLHVHIVDMYTPFVNTPDWETELMYDNLHPADAGYVVMANEWYDSIVANSTTAKPPMAVANFY